LSAPQRSDRLCDPLNLLSNACPGLLHGGKAVSVEYQGHACAQLKLHSSIHLRGIMFNSVRLQLLTFTFLDNDRKCQITLEKESKVGLSVFKIHRREGKKKLIHNSLNHVNMSLGITVFSNFVHRPVF
jgi:hypothetical protein